MRRTRGSWVVRAVFLLLAVVAWQAGVLLYVALVFGGFVLGVASVYVVKRLQVGGS